MSYYIAVVRQNEDKSFHPYFPDVEDCVVASDNMQSLTRDAFSALSLHFENNDFLHSRSLAEISGDDGVKDQIGDGATLMLVPLRAAPNRIDTVD